MTGVLKVNDSQGAAQTLPEVEFALVLSRTINALNEDPSLLRSTVYELARVTLRRDLCDGDPERDQRLEQALETAIRGVEDFEIRQKGGAGPTGSIAGPLNNLSETARLIAPTLPAVEVYSPSQHRGAALPVIQTDHPAFETEGSSYTFGRDKRVSLNGSTVRAALLAAGVALGVALAGIIITNRTGTNSLLATKPAAVAAAAPQASTDQPPATPASTPIPTEPAPPPPIPGVSLPTTYGNYAVNGGKLVELELIEGQVPDKRVAISSPLHTASRTILTDGSPTFVVFRRDLATIPTDGIEARVVAKIKHTMKFDSQTKQASYTPEELWSIRPFTFKFRSAPVPGNPEMMLIKPDGIVLPAGRYVLVLKRQGYDFTVAGKITDPNQCLERTEAANGTFYSACSSAP
jgi:hypothetical protein